MSSPMAPAIRSKRSGDERRDDRTFASALGEAGHGAPRWRRRAGASACAGIPLGALSHQLSYSAYWSGTLIALPFTPVGTLVAYRRPALRMEWIMLGFPAAWAVVQALSDYAVLAYRFDRGLPLGSVAVIVQPTWQLVTFPLVLGILLYPDGRPPSRRWRWPLRWIVAVTAAATAAAVGLGISAFATGTARVGSDGSLAQLSGGKGGSVLWNVAAVATILTAGVMLIAWLVSQAIGYRRLTRERRAQQKWIISGAVISLAAMFTQLSNATFADCTVPGVAALPAGMGVGILKYRLYEIDRLVSRTISYALLSAALGGAFVGLVALTTDVLPFSSNVGVVAATLAAIAIFNPLRRRVQRAVDRRFNRGRYDADQTVAAFAARLRDAVDLDVVQTELLNTVQRAVEPAHANVWIVGGAR